MLGCAAGAEELLRNPGFEQTEGIQPAHWQVFVMPSMEGADGRLDVRTAREGQHSARLHNPEVYATEPANNWSQNIIADLAGKNLRVRGAIKTDEATEAAIWLQCCRRRPWAILKSVTSSTDTPLYGTRDWTPVEMRVSVPAGTDYIVFRCVLLGRGTAWFDALSVDDEPEAPNEDEAKTPEKPAQAPVTPSPISDEVMKGLLESQRAMVETNRTLRGANDTMLAQIQGLQEELREVRKRLLLLQADAERASIVSESAPSSSASPSKTRTEPPPPLVPRGTRWEDR